MACATVYTMALLRKRACCSLLLLTLFSHPLLSQLKEPQVEPPPKRGGHTRVTEDEDGNKKTHVLDYDCPPTLEDGSRNPPTDPHDKNVAKHDPARTDYFMGSWKYEDKDGNDVKVTKWCINEPEVVKKEGTTWHDYFAFQIETSSAANAGVEVTKVSPGRGSQT